MDYDPKEYEINFDVLTDNEKESLRAGKLEDLALSLKKRFDLSIKDAAKAAIVMRSIFESSMN